MTYSEILEKLKSLSNPKNIEGMKRFAVGGKNTLGIPIPVLRNMAKEINKEYTPRHSPGQEKKPDEKHKLALKLWDSGIHEAKMLAAFTAVPEMATLSQIDKWVNEFDSWDICDQTCSSYFRKTKFAHELINRYVNSDKEYVKRTAFVMMAVLAVHDKKMTDNEFQPYFKLIIEASDDERNFVKKAVNWAFRQIGKRNQNLNNTAIETANEILKKYPNSKGAKWIANGAINELKLKKNYKYAVLTN
jgi:3-methyladenine DNA glycosylase AlkD